MIFQVGIDMYFFYSVASLVTFLVTALKVVMALVVVVLSAARPATTVVALVISAASKCLI